MCLRKGSSWFWTEWKKDYHGPSHCSCEENNKAALATLARSGATAGKQRQNTSRASLHIPLSGGSQGSKQKKWKNILETLHFPVAILNTALQHLWQIRCKTRCVILTTDCTLAKFAIIMYYPWLVLRQPKEDFTFTWDWKTRKKNTVFVPESEGVPEHHRHPIYRKAHFPPTLFLISRNPQDKSLCLKIPFNQISRLASGTAATVHRSSAPALTWSPRAALWPPLPNTCPASLRPRNSLLR